MAGCHGGVFLAPWQPPTESFYAGRDVFREPIARFQTEKQFLVSNGQSICGAHVCAAPIPLCLLMESAVPSTATALDN
jgi:hypothetical protein